MSHRIYMQFFLRKGWQVSFLEQDARTPLPRSFIFTNPDKVRELLRPGGRLYVTNKVNSDELNRCELYLYKCQYGRSPQTLRPPLVK